MPFMEQQITVKMLWYEVDTRHGIDYYPSDMFTRDEVSAMAEVNDEYITEVHGYGARMSAPGYLGCTEWSVFDTAEEAQEYLDEYYGDDSMNDLDAETEEN